MKYLDKQIDIPKDIKELINTENKIDYINKNKLDYQLNVYFIYATLNKYWNNKDVSYEVSVYEKLINRDPLKDVPKEEWSEVYTNTIIDYVNLDLNKYFGTIETKLNKEQQDIYMEYFQLLVSYEEMYREDSDNAIEIKEKILKEI